MRVAVVGLGAIGPLHVNSLKEAGQEIVALCDIQAQRCFDVIKKFALSSKVYTSFDEMLQSEALDAVHICTPHYLHAEMICKALSRNLNVLCEKPLAISEEQLNAIERAIKNSTAQLGVCLQHRYNQAVLYVKEFLRGKEITAGSANLIWERGRDYYGQDVWRCTWAQSGGGVMINQAIHGLDLLQWICGMPARVSANVSNVSLKNVIEVEDTAFGVFTLENGANFVMNATNAAKYCFPIYYMFRAGSDTVELSGENIIINGEFLCKSDNTPIFGKEEWGVGHTQLIKHFYECVQNGKQFPVNFEEASKVIKLILGMYASKGEEIEIK